MVAESRRIDVSPFCCFLASILVEVGIRKSPLIKFDRQTFVISFRSFILVGNLWVFPMILELRRIDVSPGCPFLASILVEVGIDDSPPSSYPSRLNVTFNFALPDRVRV